MNTQQSQIDKIRLIIQESENTGNLALMASIMADDITVIVPDTPVIIGKTAGVAFLKSWFDAFTIEISYKAQSVDIKGDMAYEWSIYHQTTTDKQTGEKASEIGRILWVYKKYKGVWLQNFVIWNTIS
ncbi:MAG: DUF4440 domain-containing protein [Bacteroidota bacterium]